MYNLNHGIEIEDIGEEVIVIDTVNGRFLEINQMGHIILSELIEGSDINVIASELANTFERTIGEATAIVKSFVNRLEEMGIICENV